MAAAITAKPLLPAAGSDGSRMLPSQSTPARASSSSAAAGGVTKSLQPVVLVVGIVSSSAATVSGLLSDLLELTHCASDGSCSSNAASASSTSQGPLLGGLEVVLLENGVSPTADGSQGKWLHDGCLVFFKGPGNREELEAEFAPFNGVHNHTVCQLLGASNSAAMQSLASDNNLI